MHRRIARAALAAAVLAASSAPFRAAAQERHHVIVVLDRSGSMVVGGEPRLRALEEAVRERLRDACFDPGHAGPDRALLDPEAGDFLSVVSFGLDARARDFGRFIQVEADGVEYGMVRRANAPADVFDELWRRIAGDGFGAGRFFSTGLSAISLALPLALEHEGRTGAARAEPAHRTFMVLVTDEQYNGPGILSQELKELESTPVRGDLAGVRARVERVYAQYDFRAGPETGTGGIHVKVFEVLPNRVFDAGSLWRFNNEGFGFRRAHGGFQSAYRLERLDAPPMRPEKVEAQLLDDGGRVLQRREFGAGDPEPVVRFALPRSARADSLRVRLRFWVRQADSVYGMRLLDPDVSEGRERLAATIPVILEPPARILGFVPLPDWLGALLAPVAGDDHGAARLCNLAVLALVALAVFAWALRASTITSGRMLVNRRCTEREA
jgi:hypothetical protein